RTRSTQLGALGTRWELGSQLLTLRAGAPMRLDDDGAATARIIVRAGETVAFSLAFDDEGPAVLPPLGHAVSVRIAQTIAWWRSWSARARYDGPDREAVVRG